MRPDWLYGPRVTLGGAGGTDLRSYVMSTTTVAAVLEELRTWGQKAPDFVTNGSPPFDTWLASPLSDVKLPIEDVTAKHPYELTGLVVHSSSGVKVHLGPKQVIVNLGRDDALVQRIASILEGTARPRVLPHVALRLIAWLPALLALVAGVALARDTPGWAGTLTAAALIAVATTASLIAHHVLGAPGARRRPKSIITPATWRDLLATRARWLIALAGAAAGAIVTALATAMVSITP